MWWETDIQTHLPQQNSRPKSQSCRNEQDEETAPNCVVLGVCMSQDVDCLQSSSFWIQAINQSRSSKELLTFTESASPESVVQSQLSLCHQGDFGLFWSKKRGITFAHQLITVIDKAQTCGVIFSFYAHIEKFILLFSCFEAGPSCFLALCYADFLVLVQERHFVCIHAFLLDKLKLLACFLPHFVFNVHHFKSASSCSKRLICNLAALRKCPTLGWIN